MKRVLLLVFSVLLLLSGIAVGVGGWLWQGARLDTVGAVDFVRPLAIPPLAASRVDATGARVFDLTLRKGATDLGHGETPTWGVNGSYLGPTIRAEDGEDMRFNVTNEIGEATSLHWHGMHLPAQMDGGPHQMIDPGETWEPHWRIDQPAATLWYHPHLHGATAEHVYRGLTGMFILDDAGSLDGLPHDYGVDDVPVIVQDKAFNDDGTLDTSQPIGSPVGFLGDEILVNGTPGPFLEVNAERTRLRLLNASNARIYDFGFSDGRGMDLIATDGGFLPEPYRTGHVRLSPGERAEVVVETEPGERVVLRSRATGLGGFPGSRLSGNDDDLDVLELRAAGQLVPSPRLPDELPSAEPLDPGEAAVTRRISLDSARSIDGERMDMGRLDQVVNVGDTEIWQVSNDHGNVHSFHVHDVQFQVLSISGVPPPPQYAGWKDTILLPSRTTTRLVMRFEDHTDGNRPYMYHCHLLRHEDDGMMGQFVVVKPGAGAGSIPGGGHDHHRPRRGLSGDLGDLSAGPGLSVLDGSSVPTSSTPSPPPTGTRAPGSPASPE